MDEKKEPPVVMTLEEHAEHLSKYDIRLVQTTCYTCDAWRECPFAFDPYNTNGDCLALK